MAPIEGKGSQSSEGIDIHHGDMVDEENLAVHVTAETTFIIFYHLNSIQIFIKIYSNKV